MVTLTWQTRFALALLCAAGGGGAITFGVMRTQMRATVAVSCPSPAADLGPVLPTGPVLPEHGGKTW